MCLTWRWQRTKGKFGTAFRLLDMGRFAMGRPSGYWIWDGVPPMGDEAMKIMKKVQLILAVSLCVFGGMLLLAGFIAPPVGEIHHSVLIAFGEILTFSGSLIGIDYKYRYRE